MKLNDKLKSFFEDEKKQNIIRHTENLIQKLNENNVSRIQKKQAQLDSNAEKLKQTYKDKKIQKTALDIQEIVYNLSLDTVKNTMNDEIQEKLIISALDEFDRIEGV